MIRHGRPDVRGALSTSLRTTRGDATVIVLKFGGSSVKDAERMRVVGRIVAGVLAERPLVVLSAMGGITDQLIALGHAPSSAHVEAIAARHLRACSDLGVDPAAVEPLLAELADLVRGIALIGECSPRTQDLLASYGERLCVRIFAAHLTATGTPAHAFDTWDLGILSDGRHGGARVLPSDREAVLAAIEAGGGVPVVTGYISKSTTGQITTFGRGGSDYSASAIGAAVGATEIQIWTDVDGVLTADPRIVPEARPILTMSFDEASEIAYYGAKVLHPATIQPAVQQEIPVRVKNTYRPEHPGTLILPRVDGTGAGPVRAIVHKRGVAIVHVHSARMLAQHGVLARIFDVFARHAVVIDMVATSEVSVSVTCESSVDLTSAAAELATFARVEIERGQGMVCVVGGQLPAAPDIAGRVFGAMAAAKIPVRMISQGATKINVAFLVAETDITAAVRALHFLVA